MTILQRQPTHAGAILKEEFLEPLGITQSHLAKSLHTSFRAINEIVNEKRGITTEMALKLAKYFGTSPQLWLNLQNQYDLYKVGVKKHDLINEIEKFEVA
jgi:addiction module HigA family antidote